MSKLRKAKYQVVTVVVPTTAVPGQVIEQQIRLDQDYSKAIGVSVSVEGTLSSLTHVDVGLRSPYGTEHDPAHIENWQANAAVAPNQKFKEINIKTDGRFTYCQVIPPAAPSAIVRIQFIFKLVDDLEVIASI